MPHKIHSNFLQKTVVTNDNFQKPSQRKFNFTHTVYLKVYRSSLYIKVIKVKVTAANIVQNPYFCNVKLRSTITLVL